MAKAGRVDALMSQFDTDAEAGVMAVSRVAR